MAISDFMYDLATKPTSSTEFVPKHSTNAKAGKSLDMDGFLQLMVATLQNQTMDNTTDTSDMMNQMVQMSVVQAISDISTLINDSTSLTYAASLVGKEVTIGQFDEKNVLHESYGTVTATGVLNGKQVIFVGDNCYNLSDVLAVGRLPENVQEKVDSAGAAEKDPTGKGSQDKTRSAREVG